MMLPYMEQTPLYNAINFSFCGGVRLRGLSQLHGFHGAGQLVPLPV